MIPENKDKKAIREEIYKIVSTANHGYILSFEDISNHVAILGISTSPDIIRGCVNQLKKKVSVNYKKSFETLRGVGYTVVWNKYASSGRVKKVTLKPLPTTQSLTSPVVNKSAEKTYEQRLLESYGFRKLLDNVESNPGLMFVVARQFELINSVVEHTKGRTQAPHELF